MSFVTHFLPLTLPEVVKWLLPVTGMKFLSKWSFLFKLTTSGAASDEKCVSASMPFGSCSTLPYPTISPIFLSPSPLSLYLSLSLAPALPLSGSLFSSSLCLSPFLSLFVSLCLSLSVSLSVCLSVCLPLSTNRKNNAHLSNIELKSNLNFSLRRWDYVHDRYDNVQMCSATYTYHRWTLRMFQLCLP